VRKRGEKEEGLQRGERGERGGEEARRERREEGLQRGERGGLLLCTELRPPVYAAVYSVRLV
jgi:hypothetical protein